MGLVASVLGIIALIISIVRDNFNWVGGTIITLLILNRLFKMTLRESLKMYGMKDTSSITWGVITTITQIGIIGLSIYSFFI